MNNKIFIKHYIVTLLLLCICLGAWAQQYVCKTTDGTNKFVCMTETQLDVTDTFDPQTCIWTLDPTVPDGTKKANFYCNGYGMSCTGTYHVMQHCVAMGTDCNNVPIRIKDGKVAYLENGIWYYYVYNYQYYLDNKTQGSGTWGSDNRGFQLVAASDTSASYAISATEVVLNNNLSVTASASASYISSVGGTITITPSLSGANYYKVGDSYYTSKMGGPYTSLDEILTTPKYSYSLVGGNANASVSDDGVVTYTSDPGYDVAVTVQVTAWRDGFEDYKTTTSCSVTLRSATVPTPSISKVPGTNTYQITGVDGATIKYTTDGTEIDASASNGTTYTGPFEAAEGTVIKERVVRDVHVSAQAEHTVSAADDKTGTDGTTVFLNDLEDHTWTYYAGIDETIDGKAYKDKYFSTNTLARIYSPNPRNVKITYQGNGIYADDNSNASGVQVSATETENTYIFCETLDRHGNSKEMSADDYFVYSVIPNPFLKRPSRTVSGTKTYYGCRKWYVASVTGGTIEDAEGNTVSVGGYIIGDTDIKLHPSDITGSGYTTNCISMQIVLKAYWEVADRVLVTSDIDYTSLTKEHRELNFLVLNRTATSTISNGNTPVTVMMVEPDGSADYRNASYYISSLTQGDAPLKIENSYMGMTSGTYEIGNHDLFLGRGLLPTSSSSYCITTMRGATSNKPNGLKYRLRVESGKYNTVGFWVGAYGPSGSGGGSLTVPRFNVNTVWGNDYDRANGNNQGVIVTGAFACGNSGTQNSSDNENDVSLNLTIKSGQYTRYNTPNTGNGILSCYFADGAKQPKGLRYINVEDGVFTNFASGWAAGVASQPCVSYRLKGGEWNGCVYGSASESTSKGGSCMVWTGGTIGGWIAGGCNGMNASGGITDGTSYLYVGGSTHVGDGNGNKTKINWSYGGNVFAAGSGNFNAADVGKMTNGTNVVVADDAVIEGSVYGGGNSGYALNGANIIIAGGTLEGTVNGTKEGNVFGGSNQNKTAGDYANVLIVGGNVTGGVYGGCNTSGTLSGNTTVTIKGGTVGTGSNPMRACGGGYGKETIVNGNVDVTVGGTATINGNVYGGSALGKTNNANTTSSKTKTTNVTMTGGTINGSLFGAGLGETAAVTTNPVVTMTGGTVTQNVFGGGDAAKVDGNTSVTVSGSSKVNGNVYGGGNAAEVTGIAKVQIGKKKE